MNIQIEQIFFNADKSPITLTNILTEVYYSDYFSESFLEDSAKDLISEFYIQHYGGEHIPKQIIQNIAETFGFNLPLVITCVYLFEIQDDTKYLSLCVENIGTLIKIIGKTHDDIYPHNNKHSHIFSDVDENEVLKITGFESYRNVVAVKESIIKKEEKENIVDKLLEALYITNEKSPYVISKLLTNLYFDKVQDEFDLNTIYLVIDTSSRIHLKKSNWLTEEQIFNIVRFFGKKVPMISFCLFIQLSKENETELQSIVSDRSIIYKIIVDVFNEIANNDKNMTTKLSNDDFGKALDILFPKN